jgi:hypothetical protein
MPASPDRIAGARGRSCRTADSLGLSDLRGKIDFALAMAVVHETPGPGWFFGQVAETMKPGGIVLLAEPSGHVKDADFEAEIDAAGAGLVVTEHPAVCYSQTALLKKN